MKKHNLILLEIPSENEVKYIFAKYSIDKIYIPSHIFIEEKTLNFKPKVVDTSEVLKTIHSEALLAFNEAGHNSIISKLIYKKFSLWYHLRYPLFNNFKSFFTYEKLAKFLINKSDNVSNIVFHNTPEQLLDNLFQFKNTIYVKKKGKKNTQKHIKQKIKFSFIFIWRAFFGILLLPRLFSKKHALITDASRNHNIINIESLKPQQGSSYSEYLQYYSSKTNDFVNIQEFFPPNFHSKNKVIAHTKFFIPRYKNIIFFETILLVGLFNPFIYSKFIKHKKKVKSKILSINHTCISNHEKILLYCIKHSMSLINLIILRELLTNFFFKYMSFKTIGGTHEHDIKVRGILESGKRNKALTYGIQHGVVYPFHLQYYFKQYDIKYDPYPDYFLVWGEKWRNSLIDFSSYDKDKVISVGQIRTDIIGKLDKLSKKDINNKLINDKPLIILASQPIVLNEREMVARDFLKLSLCFPNYQFAIKPHPEEHDYVEFFDKIASQVQTSNYIYLTADLYKILAITDITVTFHSTVGGETTFFNNNNLIILNYNNYDVTGFIEDGIAFEAKKYSELKKHVFECIEQSKKVPQTILNNFIRERAHILDSNTSKRYIEMIRGL